MENRKLNDILDTRYVIPILALMGAFSVVGIQVFIILGFGEKITLKGYETFLVQIIAFYLMIYWAFPKTFSPLRLVYFAFRTLVLIWSYLVIHGFIAFHGRNFTRLLAFLLTPFQLSVATAHLFLIIALSLPIGVFRYVDRLKREYIHTLQDKLKAEEEKRQLESANAQMRLNPHLTFNTLNFIKMVKNDPLAVEESVDLLASISHHYMTDIVTQKQVLLVDEIQQMKNQLELYKILSGGKMHLNLQEQYENNDEAAMIPPATLLTLVENMIKHGLLNDPEYPAILALDWRRNQFQMKTSNYKKMNDKPGTGIGLSCVISTLDYFFPGLYCLFINDTEDWYHLILTLQL